MANIRTGLVPNTPKGLLLIGYQVYDYTSN